LGTHDYVSHAKEYIDTIYPNRQTLILGDSRITVPSYFENHKDVKFDVIFIDGGHSHEIATADMENCFHLAHKDTIIILDDTVFTNLNCIHTVGPTITWTEQLEQNKVIEINRTEYGSERGMAWGKYVFPRVL
jgi:predicted O-methyltransferase YrrM